MIDTENSDKSKINKFIPVLKLEEIIKEGITPCAVIGELIIQADDQSFSFLRKNKEKLEVYKLQCLWIDINNIPDGIKVDKDIIQSLKEASISFSQEISNSDEEGYAKLLNLIRYFSEISDLTVTFNEKDSDIIKYLHDMPDNIYICFENIYPDYLTIGKLIMN